MIGNNGYIGRSPSDSAVTVARQVYQPTGIQTSFVFGSGYDLQYFDVYLNGAKQIRGIDYSAGDGQNFSFTTYVQPGDVVEAVTYKAFNAAQATIGIHSNGTDIGEASTLNFVGSATTFSQSGDTINVEVSGAGGGVGTAIRYPDNTESPFSYINASVYVDKDINLNTTNAGEHNTYVVVQEPRIIVATGSSITVGLGKTLVTDLYQLGDL
jgi:hypothetical protein